MCGRSGHLPSGLNVSESGKVRGTQPVESKRRFTRIECHYKTYIVVEALTDNL